MKVLLISGSPTADGSTEILLNRIGQTLKEELKHSSAEESANIEFIRLNDLRFIPCQSCAKSPEPEVCFYEDELWPVYKSLIDADIVILGSPVFFDSVSAQTKMFIDRCSCFRPPDYSGEGEHDFKKIGLRRRIGAGVLIAGERGRFDLARSVMKGFFKWTEIDADEFINFESPDFRKQGLAGDYPTTLNKADEIAKALIGRYLALR